MYITYEQKELLAERLLSKIDKTQYNEIEISRIRYGMILAFIECENIVNSAGDNYIKNIEPVPTVTTETSPEYGC
jgi:hypothetical protein